MPWVAFGWRLRIFAAKSWCIKTSDWSNSALSSNMPETSNEIVLGKVPKIDERRLVVVIFTTSPTLRLDI